MVTDVSTLFKATSSSTRRCRFVHHGGIKGVILIKGWTVVNERAIPEMRRGFRRNMVSVCVGVIGYNTDRATCWRRFLRNTNPVSVRAREVFKGSDFTVTGLSRWASRSPSSIEFARSSSRKLAPLCSCEHDLIEADPITLPCHESSGRARRPAAKRPMTSVGATP